MKIISFFLLIFASLYADTNFYIGAGGGGYSESFTNAQGAKSSSHLQRIKAGYGDRSGFAVELSLDLLANESKIFSQNDGDRYAFNLELLKSYDFDTLFNPFFKIGFGSGYLNIDGQFQKSLYFGSYNAGLGVFIPLNRVFELELCYDYRAITYEKVDTIVNTKSYESNQNSLYAGINFKF